MTDTHTHSLGPTLSLSFKIVAMPIQGNKANIVSLLIGGRTSLHGQLQKISKKVQFDSLGSQGESPCAKERSSNRLCRSVKEALIRLGLNTSSETDICEFENGGNNIRDLQGFRSGL